MGKMAKSKNHTSHNQGYKNHRNGIYRPTKQRFVSNEMVNQKLIRNTRRSRKFDPSIKKQANLNKKVNRLIANKKERLAKLKEFKANKALGIKPVRRVPPKVYRK